MQYLKTDINEIITIDKVISLFYFEFAKNYIFSGEKHDFWEFVYVDKGEVEVMADVCGYKLKQGDIIFHKPNEYHNLWANGKTAPNVMVVSFQCNSKSMKFFENKMFYINNSEKYLLKQILKEGKNAFKPHNYSKDTFGLMKNPNSNIGSEQLFKIYLEQFLISLIRTGSSIVKKDKISSSVKERSDNELIKNIKQYLKANVVCDLKFKDIINYFHLSETHLKTLFKQKTNISIMKYYRLVKIDTAKEMIREEKYTFTEIADNLGYNSLHYFSTQFKNITGMTPSEYSSSIYAIF